MKSLSCDEPGLPLDILRRRYLASCSQSMPVSGFLAWACLALASYGLGPRLPYYAYLIVAAIPLPLSIILDRMFGAPGLQRSARHNPITQLFMNCITVTGLLIPFAILAGIAAHDPSLLMLGVGLYAGIVWVPHGWGADDRAGLIHFILRAALCYAAYLLTPGWARQPAIAAAVAVSYLYELIAMKKPASARDGKS
ncbi:hypothetical protein C0V97_11690 [Asaia sp. W19]|uniref:DUF7010 family protein n=1 Tax=unclassified Asaia TaxID=2685023 RepID=UPI000F8F3579|nr:hypothetical protein [Asaia sp. W19]RUT25250.1 hypothetical protein C0V97_11690 [Asaia sp. W19]